MTVLIIAEHDNATLKSATLNAVTAATLMDAEVHLLVAGKHCGNVVEQASKVSGVSKVLTVDDDAYCNRLPEDIANLAVSLAKGYSHIVAAATAYGRSVMPRIAASLDMAQLSDIVEVKSPDTFVRPIYAGSALATVQSYDAIKVITARTTGFDSADYLGNATIHSVESTGDSGLSKLLSQQITKSTRPELTAARIIVSGGRAMGSSDNFKLLDSLADKLNAAIGASRAAVDAGFISNDYQVGQTGKIVAPDLYIAVGISGAIQHLAGMKDSKIIVAINKDPEAPIFQVADYGLVADLFVAVPELVLELG